MPEIFEIVKSSRIII